MKSRKLDDPMTLKSPPPLEEGPIAHLKHWATVTPGATAIAGPNIQLTYSELLETVTAIASQIVDYSPKGMVLISTTDEYERIYALACIMAGVASAELPENPSADELLNIGFCAILTADPSFSLGTMPVLLIRNASRVTPSPTLSKLPKAHFRVLFTSGTTGRPKAVPFTWSLQLKRIAAASAHYMKQSPFLTLVGFRTTAGNTCFFLDLWRGTPNLVPGSVDQNVALTRRFEPKGVMGSPKGLVAYAAALAAQPPSVERPEELVSAGSFISPSEARQVASQLSCLVTNVYGSTEAGLIAFSDATSDDNALCTEYPEAEVVVESRDKGDDEPGYLLVKTPYMFDGYLDPVGELTGAEEYFRSGDLGVKVSDRVLRLSGRVDDLINLSGKKIDPGPIELFARETLGFHEALSVLAVDQAGRNYHLMLVVSGSNIDLEAAKREMFSVFRTSAPQALQRVERLPRNAMGKLPRLVHIETR